MDISITGKRRLSADDDLDISRPNTAQEFAIDPDQINILARIKLDLATDQLFNKHNMAQALKTAEEGLNFHPTDQRVIRNLHELILLAHGELQKDSRAIEYHFSVIGALDRLRNS